MIMDTQISGQFELPLLDVAEVSFEVVDYPFTVNIEYSGKRCENILAIPAFPLTASEDLIHLYQRTVKGSVGDLIGIIGSIRDLSDQDQRALRQLLKKTCHLPVIEKITQVLDEYHFFHWFVETDRGPADFYMGAPRRHITPFEENALLIRDLKGDLYHIPDRTVLDEASKTLLNTVY